MTNQKIADALERVADLLEAQDANRYRSASHTLPRRTAIGPRSRLSS